MSQRWFQDVTKEAGINARHSNRVFDNPYAKIMAGYTALGASASVADFDGDGYDDVFVTDSKLGGKNHLYHNNRDFTFTDVAEKAGVANGNDETNATADSLWFDFNNDGKPDLLVVRFGHNQLFQNMGNGKFKDVSKAAGIDGYKNAITAIAFDYDRDGKLDLFVGSYFQPINIFKPNSPRFFPESFETANNGGGVTVYHNNGNGTFTDVTEKVGLKTSGWTLDLGHADADNDGFDDLYVACDTGSSLCPDRAARRGRDHSQKVSRTDPVVVERIRAGRGSKASEAVILSPSRPDQVTLASVIRMVEGPLAPLPCASETRPQVRRVSGCRDMWNQNRHARGARLHCHHPGADNLGDIDRQVDKARLQKAAPGAMQYEI